jgi:hypothetical protein
VLLDWHECGRSPVEVSAVWREALRVLVEEKVVG